MFRLTRVVLSAMFAALLNTAPAFAQSSPSGSALVTQSFTISSTGASPTLALTGGQSVCAVVIEGTTAFSGLTLVPQAASDGPGRPRTWTTVSTINGGSISTTGASTPGSIVGFGLTNFRVNVTALASGTVTGVISCNTANGSYGSQVTIGNPPSPADTLGVPLFTEGGLFTTSIGSGATTVIKNTPGRIYGMLVTTASTTVGFACYDNASAATGKIIAGFSSTALQYSTFPLQPYAANGITCASAAGGPVVTVLWQ